MKLKLRDMVKKKQQKKQKPLLEFREWSHVRRSNTCTAAHGCLWGYQLPTTHVCSPAVLQDVSQDLMFPRGLTWAHCSGPGPGFGSVQHADSAHTEQTASAAAAGGGEGRNRWAANHLHQQQQLRYPQHLPQKQQISFCGSCKYCEKDRLEELQRLTSARGRNCTCIWGRHN